MDNNIFTKRNHNIDYNADTEDIVRIFLFFIIIKFTI